MSRLFISHSGANDAEVVAIHDWLTGEGWDDVFLDLDERGITAGERWGRALNEAASRCEAVLFLVSHAWLGSSWCLEQFNLARRFNKRLFGVLIEAISVADLPAQLAGTWHVVDLASGRDQTSVRVLLPRTREEVYVTLSKEGLTQLRKALVTAGFEPRYFAWPPAHDPDRAPYRGLRPLEAEDAGIFFGRDDQIVEALDTLRGLREQAAPRLMVILGPSGVGKSSFLRAGVLPRLARDDRNFLPLPVVRPERAAITGESGLLHAVEAALAAHDLWQSRASIRDALSGGAEGVRPLLGQLVDKVFVSMLADDSDAKRPVIVFAIDQAEELFLGEGAEEGQALLSLVCGLVNGDWPGVIALFAIRSDSYNRLESTKVLEGMRPQTLLLSPMSRGAYQSVMKGPVARLRETSHALTIERRLTRRLLKDIEKCGGSDALPLLAFTLEQLYLCYGGSGALRLTDYQAFGDIRGAIEAAVNRALDAANNDARIPRGQEARLALLRRGLIPWLAGIDLESGSPRRRIARLADIPVEAAPLVNLLVEHRLLATNKITVREKDEERSEVTIEPMHEALLRQWSLLRGWLEDDFAALTTLEGVNRAARDWSANDRRADGLKHAGSLLEDAEKVAARDDFASALTAEARDYLCQCRDKKDPKRREWLSCEGQDWHLLDAQALAIANRRMTKGIGIGLVAALMLAVFAAWQWWVAQGQTTLARSQTRLAEQAVQDAQAQRDRAERDLAVVKQAANDAVLKLVQDLRVAQGMPVESARKALDAAQTLMARLAQAAPDDLQLQRRLALMLAEFAETYVATGDLARAGAAADKGVAIIRKLVVVDPSNALWQRDLSVSLVRVGDARLAAGDRAGALAAYEESLVIVESLAIVRNLAVADPGKVGWQGDLSLSHEKVGDVRLAAGDWAGALSAYEEGLAARLRLAAADPGNTTWQVGVSASLNKVGDALLAAGDRARALSAYEESVTIVRRLTAVDPNRQADLIVSLIKVSTASDSSRARAVLREALAIAEILSREDKLTAEQQIWPQRLRNMLTKLPREGSGKR